MRETKEEVLKEHQPLETDGYQIHNIKKENVEEGHREDGEKRDLQEEPHQEGHQVIVKLEYIEDEHEAVNKGALEEVQPLETEGYQIYHLKEEDCSADVKDLQETHQSVRQQIYTVKQEYLEDVLGLDDEARHMGPVEGVVEELDSSGTEEYQIFPMKEEDDQTEMQMSSSTQDDNHPPYSKKFDFGSNGAPSKGDKAEDGRSGKEPERKVGIPMSSTGKQDVRITKPGAESTILRHKSVVIPAIEDSVHQEAEEDPMNSTTCSHELESVNGNEHRDSRIYELRQSVQYPEGLNRSKHLKTQTQQSLQEICIAEGGRIPSEDYSCPYCNKIFRCKYNLSRHMRIHTGDKPYQCVHCNKKFARQSYLSLHIRTHTGEKPYQCLHCDKKFARHSDLSSHMRRHTGEKPYQCDHCNKTFSHQSSLSTHCKRMHTEEKPYQCVNCNKKFGTKKDFTCHIRIHAGEKPYQCIHCDKKFLRQSHLSCHLRTHTGEKPYQCVHCDKKFARQSHLSLHIQTHTGEKPFQCIQCNKKFIQRSYLTIHMRTHTGEKPYQCVHCDKKFAQQSNLLSHIRTHTGEKPYQCAQCDKKFAQQSALSIHMQTHTGEKPYECLHCNKKFASKHSVRYHIRTHTREKPYQCVHCNATFFKKSDLTSHIRTHTEEKPFQFETATQLKKSLPCSSLLKISRQLTNENSSKHGLDKWEKIQWEKVRHLTNLNSS